MRFKQIILLFSASVLFVSFINCSQHAFKSQTSISSANSSNPASTATPATDAATVDLPIEPITVAPIANNPANPMPVGELGNRKFIFLAQGHLGRTIMSCDVGKTWINDRSDNQAGRCWVNGDPNYVECDHNPGSAAGLDYGDGWFYSAYGHGSGTASVRRSRDGFNWQIMNSNPDGGDGAGVFYSKGLILWIAGREWPASMDGGATWARGRPSIYMQAYTGSKLDNLIVTSEDAPGGLVSQDYGKTFAFANLTNIFWSRDVQLLKGNGHLISLSSKVVDGMLNVYAGKSNDNGLTWTGQIIYRGPSNQKMSSPIFNGKEFVTWIADKMWKSTDGQTWTSANLLTQGTVVSGPVALSPTGVYVSIPNIWQSYYANQKAYYSKDGLTWTQAQLPGSHPLHRIIGGYVEASACPTK
jgi:hypothetical protein